MGEKIRILLVEDHKLISEAWTLMIESEDDMKVIGVVDNAQAALDFCVGNRPDIVLMDINLKNSSGLDATEMISNSLPKTKIIGLSLHDDISLVKRILSMGAHGYLSKNSEKKELVNGIRKVLEGETYIANEIKDRYFNSMINFSHDNAKKELTMKEIEIVKLIAQGMTSKEIADKIFVSPRTVDTHRHNILKKLNIPNAAQLSRWAMEKGYL